MHSLQLIDQNNPCTVFGKSFCDGTAYTSRGTSNKRLFPV
jgi:hypothetical protein